MVPHSHTAPPPNAQRSQQHAVPPFQYRTTCPHRPDPRKKYGYRPRDSYASNDNAAAPLAAGSSGNKTIELRPRPHRKTQTLDCEVEEPDGKSDLVKGGAAFPDLESARDAVRRAE